MAPRHVVASRDFDFLRTSSVGEGGGGAARFFLCFPCSADRERDWLPCGVDFFGLATNALNVRNNKNNSIEDHVLCHATVVRVNSTNLIKAEQSRRLHVVLY